MPQSYKDLEIWKRSVELVVEIYRTTRAFPVEERFGLTGQIRRAAVSIPCNIAEGRGHRSSGDFQRFLIHARGSLWELETQIQIAERLGYLDAGTSIGLQEKASEVGRMLSGFLSAVAGRRAN